VRCAVDGVAVWGHIRDPEADHIATTQLAINREIEEGQVSYPAVELQPGPNGPDVFRLERRLLPCELPLVPGAMVGGRGPNFVIYLHGAPPLVRDKHQHLSFTSAFRSNRSKSAIHAVGLGLSLTCF
jgi:hypothetical protein